jgi:vacuolar-type H+-ATPase subunit H
MNPTPRNHDPVIGDALADLLHAENLARQRIREAHHQAAHIHARARAQASESIPRIELETRTAIANLLDQAQSQAAHQKHHRLQQLQQLIDQHLTLHQPTTETVVANAIRTIVPDD